MAEKLDTAGKEKERFPYARQIEKIKESKIFTLDSRYSNINQLKYSEPRVGRHFCKSFFLSSGIVSLVSVVTGGTQPKGGATIL
jgi:hypothetical protein